MSQKYFKKIIINISDDLSFSMVKRSDSDYMNIERLLSPAPPGFRFGGGWNTLGGRPLEGSVGGAPLPPRRRIFENVQNIS